MSIFESILTVNPLKKFFFENFEKNFFLKQNFEFLEYTNSKNNELFFDFLSNFNTHIGIIPTLSKKSVKRPAN